MEKGLIIKLLGGFYYVKCGDRIISCRAKGGFRNTKETPFVGDTVDLRIVSEELSEGYVEKIYPRKNKIIRPPVSNIDRLIIVSSLVSPEPDTVFIDKMLIMCEHSKITPVLCFSKSDLGGDLSLASEYEKTGYKVIVTSIETGEGIESIRELTKEGITAVAGFSGVGKSSLLNSLFDKDLSETGSVSKKLSRGKHTTRHAELFPIGENAWIADTPGFSNLSIEIIKKEELSDLFIEFRPYAENCKFRDCMHIKERDCAVKEAAEEGEIPSFRYESYKLFYDTVKDINDWERK